MTADEVRQIIREELQRNYSSGAPAVPPHTHNGIDNLQLPATSIIGDAVTGDVVTQIVAGSNVTISPSTGVGVVTVSASGGGGGGTPGGSDTQVQFNDAGSFGGDSAFTWTKATNVLTLDDASGTGTASGDTITGGASRLNILTASKSATTTKTGDIRIETGANTGTYSYSGNITLQVGNANSYYGAAGNVNIYAGDSSSALVNSVSGNIKIEAGSSNVTNAFGTGGNVVINGGNSGSIAAGPVASGYGNAGNVTINAGVTSYSYSGAVGGSITLNTTFNTGGSGNAGGVPNGNTAGHIRMNVHYTGYVRMICPAVPYGSAVCGTNLALGNTGFGSGEGVFSIQNARTNPSTNPSGGGILYVTGGALTFRGSGGTVTTIAPA